MAKSDGDTTFEQAFTRLEEVVRQLEGGQQSLDRAIELYEEGMALSQLCHKMLQRAQLRISKLESSQNSAPQTDGTGSPPPSDTSSTEGQVHNLPW